MHGILSRMVVCDLIWLIIQSLACLPICWLILASCSPVSGGISLQMLWLLCMIHLWPGLLSKPRNWSGNRPATKDCSVNGEWYTPRLTTNPTCRGTTKGEAADKQWTSIKQLLQGANYIAYTNGSMKENNMKSRTGAEWVLYWKVMERRSGSEGMRRHAEVCDANPWREQTQARILLFVDKTSSVGGVTNERPGYNGYHKVCGSCNTLSWQEQKNKHRSNMGHRTHEHSTKTTEQIDSKGDWTWTSHRNHDISKKPLLTDTGQHEARMCQWMAEQANDWMIRHIRSHTTILDRITCTPHT